MNKKIVSFMDNFDLTDEQIRITHQTYIDHAEDYVTNYERKEGALEFARPHTLDPFIELFKKYSLVGPVLFAGCGSGRDMQVLEQLHIESFGLDLSPKMIKIASDIGVRGSFLVGNIENLPFKNNFFDGIFCETALSHIKRGSLPSTLKHFFNKLRHNGIVLLGFREGDGHVYKTTDLTCGDRYQTTITLNLIIEMIQAAGFIVKYKKLSPHRIKSKPNFINIIAQKIK